MNFEQAKILVIKEFLAHYLNYDQEELTELQIVETRILTRGDNIINIAMADEEQIREMYYRKSELKREDITIRGYIPPNFFERYMAINRTLHSKKGR